ncbi:MAG: TIM-barrel domain-containing protein, partial [Halobacteriales archaeon]
ESESTFGVDMEGEPLGNYDHENSLTVPISIRFYDDSTFRFELQANPEADRPDRLVDLHEDRIDRSVSLAVDTVDDELQISTGTLTLHLGIEEWSFEITGAEDSTLFREQRADFNAKGETRVDPMGFTDSVVNRWPYAVTAAGTSFVLGPDERFYGFGETFSDFDKRGQRVESWVTQPNGCESPDAYKNVPFYLSTRGYGLLVDTPEKVTFDLGMTSTTSGEITVQDDTFSFVFFYGPEFPDIIETYTGLTGRASRPPKWTFGIWLSRYGLKNRQLVENIVERIRAENLPWDAVKLDPYWLRPGHSSDMVWDRDAFPDPEGMIESLHDRNIRVVLWEHPYLPVGSDAFETAREEGYFVSDSTGKPYILDRLAESARRGAIVDFSDPGAVSWWQDKHRRLLEMGVDGFWTDFGEYLPKDAVLANGRGGKSMRNVYPGLYNEAVYDVTADVLGEENAFVWARSAWIGGQTYPMYWSGDPQTTFAAMASTLRGGLSIAISGFPFWSHDIGGFSGQPTPELYIRWAQFGLLTTQSRFHGTTPREPWEFGDRAVDVVRKFAELRYSLLPYIYSHAEMACRSGMPVMRPLVLEYQDDPAARTAETQYLLGDALLIAPVFEAGGDVSIYLPADDEWIDFWSDTRHEGGQVLDRTAPIDEMPVFVRSESIIPRREPTQSVEDGTPNQVRLEVTLDEHDSSSAETDYYHEEADRLVAVSVDINDTRDRLDWSVSPDIHSGLFEGVVRGVSTAPDRVVLNGSRLERADDTPSPGEWSFDEGAGKIRCSFPH